MSEEQEKGRNGDWNEHWNLDCHSAKLKVSFAFEFGALEPVVQTCDNRYTNSLLANGPTHLMIATICQTAPKRRAPDKLFLTKSRDTQRINGRDSEPKVS